MSDLQLILIVLGVILIIGVLGHGLWVSRKNAKPQAHWGEGDIDKATPSINLSSQEQPHEKVEPSIDAQGFDEYGVSQARVIGNEHLQPTSTIEAPQVNDSYGSAAQPTSPTSISSLPEYESDSSLDAIPSLQDAEFAKDKTADDSVNEEDSGPLYAPAVSNPKPSSHYQSKRQDNLTQHNDDSELPPPPPSYLQTESTPNIDSPELAQKDNLTAPSFQSNNLGMPVSQSASDAVQQTAKSATPPEASPSSSVVKPSGFDESEEASHSTQSTHSTPDAVEPVRQSLTDAAMGLFSRSKSKNRRSQKRTEPKVNENQFNMDFDSVDPVLNEAKAASQLRQNEAEAGAKQVKQTAVNNDIEPEFLSISVKATDENPITGARLLPLLLTLGLKYGDKDIFHRHVNINGKGPVLFSLANMYKPGTFDIENMETLNTKGVTLFMSLPTESDAHQVFNMMHNAARKLADEFDAQVWDDSRSILTMQGLQQYVERIRNFEKRRLLG